jgi:hypothetical protein
LTLKAIQAAIALEQAVRAAGALLFIDTDERLWVLYPHKVTAELTQLCTDNYVALNWLLRARASES